MKKIIALDIDEFRVGVSGQNYKKILSSLYSTVKRNNWKSLLYRGKKQNNDQNIQGKRILLSNKQEPINWGFDQLYSRRKEAYQSFGSQILQLDSAIALDFVEYVLSYLAADNSLLFEQEDNKLHCSLCIGVGTENLDQLEEFEKLYLHEFKSNVDGIDFTIIIDSIKIIPKSLAAILEKEANDSKPVFGDGTVLEGLNYVVDVNDHYINCDIYDNGELIKNEQIYEGLYELSDKIVKEYTTSLLKQNLRPFHIDREMVYNMIVNTQKRDPFIITINGNQAVNLTELVHAEFIEETQKVLAYLNNDYDVRYADAILIRDISAEVLKEDSINAYLNTFGMQCRKFNNKSALGMYLFGEVFWNDTFLSEEKMAVAEELNQETSSINDAEKATENVSIEENQEENQYAVTQITEDDQSMVTEKSEQDFADDEELFSPESILQEQSELLKLLANEQE